MVGIEKKKEEEEELVKHAVKGRFFPQLCIMFTTMYVHTSVRTGLVLWLVLVTRDREGKEPEDW